MPMPNPASESAREARPRDELAGILRDCADRVPGSLERLLACYDEHLRPRRSPRRTGRGPR